MMRTPARANRWRAAPRGTRNRTGTKYSAFSTTAATPKSANPTTVATKRQLRPKPPPRPTLAAGRAIERRGRRQRPRHEQGRQRRRLLGRGGRRLELETAARRGTQQQRERV